MNHSNYCTQKKFKNLKKRIETLKLMKSSYIVHLEAFLAFLNQLIFLITLNKIECSFYFSEYFLSLEYISLSVDLQQLIFLG